MIQGSVNINEKIEEVDGKLASQREEDKLMHSVFHNDKKKIEDGKLINESINHGLGELQPELIFENLVDNFSQAKKLYGKTLIKEFTGYDDGYIEKNLNIPEFKKVLKKKIQERFSTLDKEGILNKDGEISEKGFKLASLILYLEEIEQVKPEGDMENFVSKVLNQNGLKSETKNFSQNDKYRDIALKKSVRTAIRRSHNKLEKEDLKSFRRKKSGKKEIVFVLDASGSMKGNKIDSAKKAGVALAYKSIDNKDKIGLIVFSSKIKRRVELTSNLKQILNAIVKVKPSNETHLSKAIMEARELFSRSKVTKHIILLTDAVPTIGEKPEENVLKEVSICRTNNISISIIGIELDEKGKKLGKKITEVSGGRLYLVKKDEKLDRIVLLDYSLME